MWRRDEPATEINHGRATKYILHRVWGVRRSMDGYPTNDDIRNHLMLIACYVCDSFIKFIEYPEIVESLLGKNLTHPLGVLRI